MVSKPRRPSILGEEAMKAKLGFHIKKNLEEVAEKLRDRDLRLIEKRSRGIMEYRMRKRIELRIEPKLVIP